MKWLLLLLAGLLAVRRQPACKRPNSALHACDLLPIQPRRRRTVKGAHAGALLGLAAVLAVSGATWLPRTSSAAAGVTEMPAARSVDPDYDVAPSALRQQVIDRRAAHVPLPNVSAIEAERQAQEQAAARQQDQAIIAGYFQEILSRDQRINQLETAVRDDSASLAAIASQLGLPKSQLATTAPAGPKNAGALLPADRDALSRTPGASAQSTAPVGSLADLQALVARYLALPCPLPASDWRCRQAVDHARQELARGHGLDLNTPDALPTLNMSIAQPFGVSDLDIEPIEQVNGQLVHFHDGLDLAAAEGEPVMAAAAGTVVFAGIIPSGAQTIEIAHAGGQRSLYLHESQLLVSVGQQVEKGQLIGLVGATGIATGPHVHFQIDDASGRAIDPLPFLR